MINTGKFPAKRLKALYEQHGSQNFYRQFNDLVESKDIRLNNFSIKDLATTFLGDRWQNKLCQLGQMGLRESSFGAISSHTEGHIPLMEAGAPVGSSTFANIIGQLVFSTIREQFTAEEFVFTREVPVVESRIKGTETVPSITRIGDKGEIVGEGQEYPNVGVNEEFFTWATKNKRGMVIDLTEESIFFDLTNQLVQSAGAIGRELGIKREKDIIDTLTGATNNYSRNGTATNTWLTAGAYINTVVSTPLTDWKDIDTLERLMDDILDPNTGEPIELSSATTKLVVTSFNRHTAMQIVGATQLRTTDNAAAGTRSFETISANTLQPYQIVTSRLLKRRLIDGLGLTDTQARHYWWVVDLSRALAWVENWPLRTFSQGANSEAAFERDVSMRFKASYRGVAQVVEPRYGVRATNT